jgi:hypothetical protein
VVVAVAVAVVVVVVVHGGGKPLLEMLGGILVWMSSG